MAKCDWTMAEAQAWVEANHKKELEEAVQEYFTKGIAPKKEEYKEIIQSIMEEADKELSKETETKEETEEEASVKQDEKGEEIEEEIKEEKVDETEVKDEGKEVVKEAHSQIDLLKKICDEMNLVIVHEGEEVPWKYDGFIYLGKTDNFKEKDKLSLVKFVKEQYEKLLQEKDDHIADLKEGRVLSRKNRDVVKAAIKALSDVLKADATGTQEDTDSAGEGTVTEREAEIEIIKDGEKEFSKEDIAKVIKETSGPALVDAVEKALKETLDPEKLKEAMKEIARIELQRIRGKVE